MIALPIVALEYFCSDQIERLKNRSNAARKVAGAIALVCFKRETHQHRLSRLTRRVGRRVDRRVCVWTITRFSHLSSVPRRVPNLTRACVGVDVF